MLIVDDTASSLESVRLSLEGAVPTVFTAASGEEALEVLSRQAGIEAVLTDIMMPGMSGIELAMRIASIRNTMPVVLMTGYSSNYEEGADLGHTVVILPVLTGFSGRTHAAIFSF